MKTLIIGGVAGGATAAARLRRLDENAEIILVERGEFISFANCGLPYYIGGKIEKKSALTLQTPKSFNARYNVDVRVCSEVVKIDRERKFVTITNLQSAETYDESYDKLILSPGAKPITPSIPGADSARIFTLRNIPDTFAIKEFIEENQPESVAILGGGAIGIEMAENFHHLGLKVIVIELADQIIAPIDFDMACAVQNHIRSKGIDIILGNGVKSILEDGDKLRISLDDGEVIANMLLLSAGVRPESGLAKDCGLDLNERGFIVTDDNMRTNDPDIYAVGDVVEITDFVTQSRSAVALAGPANKQGRVAADNICGVESIYTGTQGSSILKIFEMTVASTGLNEKTANRLGIKFDKSFTVSSNHATYYPESSGLTIKTLFDPDTGRILGAQIVGSDGADKRCDVIATAIRFGATAFDLAKLELCYAPPFNSAKDPVNMAGFVIENLLTKKANTFHWHDIDDKDLDGVTLLDVRTEKEFENGTIPGFINIPLDELRKRINEIDPGKPVYVTCQVGLRGYVACRILMQNGYDALNLSGGYSVWNMVKKGKCAQKGGCSEKEVI